MNIKAYIVTPGVVAKVLTPAVKAFIPATQGMPGPPGTPGGSGTIVQTLAVPGSIAIPALSLVSSVVVESATAQSITIERTPAAADLIDNEALFAGQASLFSMGVWSGAAGSLLHFRSFTNPITVYIFKSAV